jgi:predicted dehydrogenase
MLNNETLDILDVCTPTDLHKEHSIMAMKAGIHVLSEKPVALCAADADEIFETANANHVKFMVAHVVRFMYDYRILKQLCSSKLYGDVIQGHFWRLSSTPKWSSENWMMDKKRSGGVPFDLHIHDIDYIVSLFGKPISVSATRGKSADKGYPDHYVARYDYPDSTIVAEASWFDGAYPFQVGFRVLMQKAVVESMNGKITAYVDDGTVKEYNEVLLEENTGINITSTDGYMEEMIYFKDCVKQNIEVAFVKKQEILDVLNIVTEGVQTSKENLG